MGEVCRCWKRAKAFSCLNRRGWREDRALLKARRRIGQLMRSSKATKSIVMRYFAGTARRPRVLPHPAPNSTREVRGCALQALPRAAESGGQVAFGHSRSPLRRQLY
jgi:hypothetical protein